MSTTLNVLRRNDESARFARLDKDDSRTAIAANESAGLEASLKRLVDGEVRFDKGTRALYATDGSNYRQVPIGVVIPRHVQDVETTMRIAREHGAPILARGGGTSLAGQCCNVAVVMDFSKYMHQVLKIDAANKLGHVQPGCVLDHFREQRHSCGLA
jgi:FAD/FMN-containing dehydrogenase